MNITVLAADPATRETPLLAVPVFEGDFDAIVSGLDAALGGQLSALRRRGDLRGKENESLLLYPEGRIAAERLLLVGAGKAEALTGERLRRVGGTAAKQAAKVRSPSLSVALPSSSLSAGDAARALAEGVVLGSYVFNELKSKPEDAPIPVALADAAILVGADVDDAAAREGA